MFAFVLYLYSQPTTAGNSQEELVIFCTERLLLVIEIRYCFAFVLE